MVPMEELALSWIGTSARHRLWFLSVKCAISLVMVEKEVVGVKK